MKFTERLMEKIIGIGKTLKSIRPPKGNCYLLTVQEWRGVLLHISGVVPKIDAKMQVAIVN